MFLLFILGPNSGAGGPVRGLRGEEEEGGVRSGALVGQERLGPSLVLGPLNSLKKYHKVSAGVSTAV